MQCMFNIHRLAIQQSALVKSACDDVKHPQSHQNRTQAAQETGKVFASVTMHCVWGSDRIGLGTLTRLFLVQRVLTGGEFGEKLGT